MEMHSIYQRVLVAKTLLRPAPIRTGSIVVRHVLDNYNKFIVIDKHTLVGVIEKEESFCKELLNACVHINGPELMEIESDVKTAQFYDNMRGAAFLAIVISVISVPVFDTITFFMLVTPPSLLLFLVSLWRSERLGDKVQNKVDLLRGFERRLIEVPNTEEMLELMKDSAKE